MEVKQHEQQNEENAIFKQMQRSSLIILFIVLALLAAIVFFLFDPALLKNESIFPNQSGVFVPLLLAGLSIILAFVSRKQYPGKTTLAISEVDATPIPSLETAIGQLEQEAPFHVNEPLRKDKELFGREDIYNYLKSLIINRTAISIVGPRKIGKTWLIEYLKLKLNEDFGRHYRIAHLAATQPSCSTIEGFTKSVFELFGCADLLPTSKELKLKDLEILIAHLDQEKIVPVLCIDEFEGFGKDFDGSFFSELRNIANAGKLTLIVSSTNTLNEMRGKLGQYLEQSLFNNIFKEMKVGPFNEEQAETFLETKRKQARFTKPQISELKRYSQEPAKRGTGEWLPLRLQLAGQLLWKDILQAKQDKTYGYRPDRRNYWPAFEKRLENAYRGVVPPE